MPNAKDKQSSDAQTLIRRIEVHGLHLAALADAAKVKRQAA